MRFATNLLLVLSFVAALAIAHPVRELPVPEGVTPDCRRAVDAAGELIATPNPGDCL
ncbi:hypothetical protein BV20DRAFT_969810 [Pilatotrama ljubarskyi]|nr:hypothetical protein BV20DRAFT_969810 [Pilatotrama ljubarskyi]